MQRTMMRESEIGLQADLRHWQERARKAEADNRRMREALKTIVALQQGYLGGDDGRKSGYRICGKLAEKGLGLRGMES